VDALRGRVVEQTCLGAGLITDEHHQGAAIFKFLEPLASLLDKGYASKLMKMVHYRFHSMPYLVRSLTINTLSGQSIEYVDHYSDSFAPKIDRHGHGFQHNARHRHHDRLISSFDDPILLQRVGGS
jgi:hypothetical protein